MAVILPEQQHFYEERWGARHDTVYWSWLKGIAVGECGCSELFIVHMDTEFAAGRQIKLQWKQHAKGQTGNADRRKRSHA